jgi:hypothetical protein
VTSKPRALADGDVISVGGRALFSVQLGAADDAPSPKPAATRLSSRTRLWSALGIYIAIVLAIMMFFNLKSDGDETAVKLEDEWTRAQIDDHLTRDLPVEQPNAQKSAQYLLQARRDYELRDVARGNLFAAYDAYRHALNLSGSDHFDNADDVLRFADAEKALIDRVTRLYKQGHAQLLSRRWTDASRTYQQLLDAYPDPTSTLYKHVVKQRTTALKASKKKRRRGR